MEGISEKSEPKIRRYYRDYDEQFPASDIVESRILEVIDVIGDAFGEKMVESPLSNRIIFYALFAAVYDKLYTLGSSIEKSVRPSKIDNLGKKLTKLSSTFDRRDTLPDEVQDALISRSNRKSNRVALTNHISRHL